MELSMSKHHFPFRVVIRTAVVNILYISSDAVVGPQGKDMLIFGRCCQLSMIFQPQQQCVNIPILFIGKAKYYHSLML